MSTKTANQLFQDTATERDMFAAIAGLVKIVEPYYGNKTRCMTCWPDASLQPRESYMPVARQMITDLEALKILVPENDHLRLVAAGPGACWNPRMLFKEILEERTGIVIIHDMERALRLRGNLVTITGVKSEDYDITRETHLKDAFRNAGLDLVLNFVDEEPGW